ncbi:MAG: tetratricopeptide repeat protein, partial [Methanosarcina sp.]|nr:tetratricopeptide repeat protein [Methanosarcina sp.]
LLNLPVKDDSDQNLVVSAVKNWLRTNNNWLLVLDNADYPYLIEYFLPSNIQGHVLLTSRAPTFDNLGITNPIEVKKMLPEEAKEFFLVRTGHKNLDQSEIASLEELIRELDCLPLAMEQAGAYIHKLKCSFAEYLSSYRKHGLELLEKSQVQNTKYSDSVATTWLLNFEQVKQTSKTSTDILSASAFLNCNNIPFEVFIKGSGELGENIYSMLHDIEDDRLVFKEAIEPLRQFSLISTYYDKNTFDIHRLVQVVLRDGIEKNEQQRWAESVVKALNRAFPKVEYKNWELCDKLLPHVQTCAEYIRLLNIETEESAKLLNATGNYLHKRARFKESESLLKSSLEIRKKILEPEHYDLSESLNNLGELYIDLGRYSEVEPLYVRALEIRENTLEPDDPAIAESLNNLGELYNDFGRYSEAESLHLHALDIRENTLNPDDPAIADSLDNLAGIYIHLDRFSEAESLRIRALDITEKAFGFEHPDVAACLNNLAGVYNVLGRFSEAKTLLIRSLNISEKALGPEHPAVGVSLNNLAGVYNNLGRSSEAETLCIRALKITEDALGPEHPYMSNRLTTLAEAYRNFGKYSEAETLLIRALEIAEKALGSEHPDVGISLSNLAVFFKDRNKYFKSKSYYERAIKVTEKTRGENSLEVARLLEGYASLLAKMKRNRDATTKHNRAKWIRSKIEKGSKK